MYGETSDIVCTSILLLLLALYGLWLTIRSIQQIREPTHISNLGIGWFTSLIQYFAGQKNTEELNQAYSTSINVRMAAGCALATGIMLMALPLFVYIMVRWILP